MCSCPVVSFCVSILVSQVIGKHQKDNIDNLNLPFAYFAFSLAAIFRNNLVSLGFIFRFHHPISCYLALAEYSCCRLVPVENTTLAVRAKYPAVLTIDHFGAVAGD